MTILLHTQTIISNDHLSPLQSGECELLRNESQMVRRMEEVEVSSLQLLQRSPERFEEALPSPSFDLSPSGPTVVVWGSEEDSISPVSYVTFSDSFPNSRETPFSLLCSSTVSLSVSSSDVSVDDLGYEADISTFEDEIFL